MKVLHVNNYSFSKGGSDKYFITISKYLDKYKNLKIKSYSLLSSDDDSSIKNLCNIKLKRLNKFSIKLIFDIYVFYDFIKALRNYKPDIIHLHIYYGQLTSSILFALLFFKKIKIIQTSHEYKLICPIQSVLKNGKYCQKCRYGNYFGVIYNQCNPKGLINSIGLFIDNYIDFFLRFFLNKRIKILAVSNFQKNILFKRGLKDNLIGENVLFSDFDINSKPNKIRSLKNLSLIYVGRIEKFKGIYILPKLLLETSIIKKLIIIGDGSEMDNFIKKIKKLNLTDKIHILGYQNKLKIIEELDKADIFINPSSYLETFGLTNLEALSRGKIVISSTSGAHTEILKHEENGFLFDPHNFKSLVNIFENLKNYDLISIQKNSIKTAKIFSSKNHIKKLNGIYQKIINK